MVVVQVIFILFALFALTRVFVRVRKRELSHALGSLAVVIWASVIAFALQPEWLDRIAEVIGVGRGVDTATYISILVIFYLIFKIFVRLEKLEDHLTSSVRDEALSEYRKKNSK